MTDQDQSLLTTELFSNLSQTQKLNDVSGCSSAPVEWCYLDIPPDKPLHPPTIFPPRWPYRLAWTYFTIEKYVPACIWLSHFHTTNLLEIFAWLAGVICIESVSVFAQLFLSPVGAHLNQRLDCPRSSFKISNKILPGEQTEWSQCFLLVCTKRK